MLFTIILAGFAIFFSNYCYRLFNNYMRARQVDLPIIICFATWQNPLWILLTSAIPVRKLARFPGLRWTRYSYLGWVLDDMCHTHARLGSAFIIVSAKRNEVILADPEAVTEVMSKYKRWLRPREMYILFTTFGENVDTTEGVDWQRHRKILGAGFSELHNEVVWNTTVNQTTQWLLGGKQNEQALTLTQLNNVTNIISANVLLHTSFGKDYTSHERGLKYVKPGYKKSLYEAMHYMLINILSIYSLKNMKLPAWLPYKPKGIREIPETITEVQRYFNDILTTRSGDFVKAVIEANENEKASGRPHLNHEELCANMYILQLAGFDTTSYAMGQTLARLSAYPEIQEWVREELVVASDTKPTNTNTSPNPTSSSPSSSSYKQTYPSTIRIQAAILESLRLHTPAPNLVRISPDPETLSISGKDYLTPPNTLVACNLAAIHNDPSIWGSDAGKWRPQRWIETNSSTTGTTTTDNNDDTGRKTALTQETLKHRPEMMAWALGPRKCPGKKFSLVEIVAALSTVLKSHKLVGSGDMHEILGDYKFSLTPSTIHAGGASVRFVKI